MQKVYFTAIIEINLRVEIYYYTNVEYKQHCMSLSLKSAYLPAYWTRDNVQTMSLF